MENKFKAPDTGIIKMETLKEIKTLGPSFPKFPQFFKLCITWSLDGLNETSIDVKCEVEHFPSLSVHYSPWFGVFGPHFYKLIQYPYYNETDDSTLGWSGTL